MSDEVVNDSANVSADSAQAADRPRKSRRRGKRNRSRSNEAGQEPVFEEQQSTSEVTQVAPPPQRERERGHRRSGSHRSGAHGFGDGLDRIVCAEGLRRFPVEWPVTHRRELAAVPLREVARRGTELLLCDHLHDGPCLWPDGEPVGLQATETPVQPAADITPESITPPPDADPASDAGV